MATRPERSAGAQREPWDPGEHPRDPIGRFALGGGSPLTSETGWDPPLKGKYAKWVSEINIPTAPVQVHLVTKKGACGGIGVGCLSSVGSAYQIGLEPNASRQVLYHELGHVFDVSTLSDDDRAGLMRVFGFPVPGRDPAAIEQAWTTPDRGGMSPAEWFAGAYRYLCALPPSQLRGHGRRYTAGSGLVSGDQLAAVARIVRRAASARGKLGEAKGQSASRGRIESRRKPMTDLTKLLEAALTSKQRKNLPKGAFVFPDKAPGPGSYPIHDEAHAANALARSSGKPEEGRVRAAVCRRYPSMGACKQGKVQEARRARETAAAAGDSQGFYRALERERALVG